MIETKPKNQARRTGSFYDVYWPRNVPGYRKTREHVREIVPDRKDNPTIESLVEDWYFVPEKHLYSIGKMRRLFKKRGLTYQVVSSHTGRFRSTSNFIVRGILDK